MHAKKLFLLSLFVLSLPLQAQKHATQSVVCGANDSARVEALLKEAKGLPKGTNLPLFFAKKFLNVPYVAHTLEKGDPERLVINLDELDCTTYIDVVAGLVRAARAGKTDWASFCQNVRQQRYPKGVINGYTSRNHYFSQWIDGGERAGFSHEIGAKDCKGRFNPFTGSQKLDINFMSRHPDFYDALKRHPEYVKAIAATEKSLTGKTVSYIPTSQLNLSRQKLSCIHNGDILALVTSKEGLDVSHLGMAVWLADGKLHLLNASSLSHKVLTDSQTLYQYMSKQKTGLGIRVIRLK